MLDWLADRAKATPHGLALIIRDKHWTFDELNQLVDRAAANLAISVQPGQHVGVLLPNNLAYVCLIHALARIGAVLVPLNTRLTDHELAWQLDQSDCLFLISTHEMANRVEEFLSQKRQFILDEEIFNNHEPRQANYVRSFLLDNIQSIVFTSGTSGQPKGAVLTFANHFWSAVSSAFRLGVHKDDRWLSCLPLYHVGGLAVIFRSCLYGTAVVLHDRFDEAAISESLDTQAISLISLVPTMVDRLISYRGSRSWPSGLRHILMGGAAAPTTLLDRCSVLNLPLSITYGLTEAASQVTTMVVPGSRYKPGSAGKPLLFTSVDIVNNLDQNLPPGEIGEICVSGPTLMKEYYNDEEATNQALRHGRLHTGDMGYLDQDGDLWLVQRRSDLIVSGGENIYPSEVENTLLQHPAIAAVCVVGIPDSHWGQRVGAMIELRPDTTLSIAEIQAFGRKMLAGYKLPRQIQLAQKLPLTASGKIHRQRVLEVLQAPGTSLSAPDCFDDNDST